MLHNNFLRGHGPSIEMSPRKLPETPSDVGQSEEYKANPALFALALTDHSGFEALRARTMTPPPRYTRHETPRLTLEIPDDVEEDVDPASLTSVESPQPANLLDSLQSSPVPTSPAKQGESKFYLKVIQRGQRFTRKLRKSTRSSTSTSPQSQESSPMSALPPNDLEQATAIQELDGRQIETVSTPLPHFNRSLPSSNHHSPARSNIGQVFGFQRTGSVSSIMPTPRRGLSLAVSASRQAQHGNVNSTELIDRLESLLPTTDYYDVVSPCSPTSPTATTPSGEMPLSRSNAITDRINSVPDLVSPLSPLPSGSSPPPTSPTLDGRLHFLPKLTILGRDTQRRHKPVSSSSTGMNLRQKQFAELDCGKELVVRSPADTETMGWYTSPLPGSSSTYRNQTNYSVPRITVDAAANAPELVPIPQYGNQLHHSQPNFESLRSSSPRPYTGRPYPTNSPLGSLAGSLWDALLKGMSKSTELLRQAYGPEPPVPQGRVRVRWRCTCGEHVYDDFIENRSGAAAKLEGYLNRVPNQWPNTPASSNPSSAGGSIFSAGSNSSALNSATTWGSQASSSPTLWNQQLNHKQPIRVASSNPYLSLKPYIEPLWLYTCVNEGKWTTKMRHLDVNNSKINSDKDLALALGALYSQVNRKWYKLFKLRGLVSINFVQFELHRNRYADISKAPAVPNVQTPDGSTYDFTPHDLTPPVGSNYLMHLFKHPYDYDDELITYLRTPKRRDRLEAGTGWGLQLVEGFLAERVWAGCAILSLIGSIVFVVCWIRGTGDVQGAFGVAGWIVTIFSLVGAWIQAYLS